MVVATAANSAQSRKCVECGCPQIVKLKLSKSRNRKKWRFLVMGLITIPGTILRAWHCDNCGRYEDAGTRWVEVPAPDPIRPEIVNAIRRLRKAGHRFFDWEKVNDQAAS